MIRTRTLILLAFSLGLVSYVTAKTKTEPTKETYGPNKLIAAAKPKKKQLR